MGLVLKEKILLKTPQGMSEIQLLFGDITQLPIEEKVDYIFTSAFPGDYCEVPGTLIGALKRNLGLRVGVLATDKEMDLRQNFNCWVSKNLPEEMPYRRLVCFERMSPFEKLSEQISGIFRAMMPVFNNADTTVITPLLAAGNQGHSEVMILKSIVKAACHWIRAGLPLRCLKVVLYMRNPHQISDGEIQMIKTFTDLKKKWETQKDLEVDKVEKKYDVCLSFSEKDEGVVKGICGGLQKVDVKIRVFSQHFTYHHEEVWQETIFQTMIHSKKIVAVLTPNYISDAECLEQFSLALCVNRLNKVEALSPFYVQTIDAFPSYMTLVQYTECRVRKEGEVAEQKIYLACSMLIKSLDKDDQKLMKAAEKDDGAPAIVDKKKYDVFISYAHRTPVEANRVHQALLDIDPDLRIFFDKSELTTGNIWQETLYEAVDKARCVIALITESYLQSTVCQEEYNIALARFMSSDGICFIPVLTDADIKEIPAAFAQAPMVDVRDVGDRYNEMNHLFAERVLKWLKEAEMNQFMQPPKQARIAQVTETWRKRAFNQRFVCAKEDCAITFKQDSQAADKVVKDAKPSKTVVFSCAKDCFKYAAALSKFLSLEKRMDVKCEFLMPQETTLSVQPPKLQLLDSADMVVVFVSDEYLTSIQHRHELHIALCRQRMTKDRPVVYLIQANHIKPQPVYPHLLHHSINLGDKMWQTMSLRIPREQDPVLVKMPGGADTLTIYCYREEKQALTTAAMDIVAKLEDGPGPEGSGMPTNIVNLEHLIQHLVNKGVVTNVPVEKCLVSFASLKDQKKIAVTQSADAAVADEPPVTQSADAAVADEPPVTQSTDAAVADEPPVNQSTDTRTSASSAQPKLRSGRQGSSSCVLL
ncbi:hypothetical protein BaRGS_00028371 [Batillaria attramentaria]|uniref:TIR domain-containing protein n=1 Tax=Batillaria attramentaria TaxID=370345 RepID=A0ABD0JZU2_9CAEN